MNARHALVIMLAVISIILVPKLPNPPRNEVAAAGVLTFGAIALLEYSISCDRRS